MMRARVQTKRSNVVSCGLVLVPTGLGSFRPQEGTDRTESCSLAGLPVFVSRSNCLSAKLSVSVSDCSARRRPVVSQRPIGRSVGERRNSRAVKRLRNGASDMMTEAEGVERDGAVGERVVVIGRDGRRPLDATGLRLSCDTAATVPAQSLPLCFFCCSLQSCVLRSAAGKQGESGRASPSATRTRSPGQARRRTVMDGFLTEADDADQRRAADGELDFQRRLVVGTIGRGQLTQVGQSVKRDIKAGRQTARRRPPRDVDRRVGQLVREQALCFWGTEANSQPRSSSSSSDDGGGGVGWRLEVVVVVVVVAVSKPRWGLSGRSLSC